MKIKDTLLSLVSFIPNIKALHTQHKESEEDYKDGIPVVKPTYVINKATINGHEQVTLFKERTWIGKGYGMGWYGAEFYQNAHAIAYLDEESHKVVTCDTHYSEVNIFSIYTEDGVKATTDAEAIEQFKKKCFVV